MWASRGYDERDEDVHTLCDSDSEDDEVKVVEAPLPLLVKKRKVPMAALPRPPPPPPPLTNEAYAVCSFLHHDLCRQYVLFKFCTREEARGISTQFMDSVNSEGTEKHVCRGGFYFFRKKTWEHLDSLDPSSPLWGCPISSNGTFLDKFDQPTSGAKVQISPESDSDGDDESSESDDSENPDVAKDELFVSCYYNSDRGEYVLHTVWTKTAATRCLGSNTYLHSVRSSCTAKHASCQGYYWFAKSKFDHLTSQNRPKDKDLWGCPSKNSSQVAHQAIKRKEREEEAPLPPLPPRQAKVNHKVTGLGKELPLPPRQVKTAKPAPSEEGGPRKTELGQSFPRREKGPPGQPARMGAAAAAKIQDKPKEKVPMLVVQHAKHQGVAAAKAEKGDDDEEEELQRGGRPPAKRLAVEPTPATAAPAAVESSFTNRLEAAVAQDSLFVAHLQEALKSERKDKERAWAQNDFLKDELARSREDLKEQREDNKALRDALRASRQQVSLLLASQPSERAAAAGAAGATTATDVSMMGPDTDFGFDQWN